MMQVTECNIKGLKIIQLDVIKDSRGFFMERFHLQQFADAGLPTHFVQDNHSRSAPGVLRGLHYQHEPAQGKLVGVTSGCVLDIAVDIRPDSKTYGQHHAIEISADKGILFWIPEGFAHGFCVLGEQPVDMLYKLSAPYHAAGEGGIAYDDPELAICWPIENPVISERDKNQQSFVNYKKSPPKWSRS